MKKNFILGVGITNETKEDILKYIITSLEKKGETYYITTPNPEFLVHAAKNSSFRSILNNARLALPDGIGVIMAGKFLRKEFKQRLTGVDFMETFCKEVSKKPITVGFLGGRGGVAERTAECLRARYPGLKVVFAASEWSEDLLQLEPRLKIKDERLKNNKKIINHKSLIINHTYIDILFVAFGFPKQEQFMADNLGKIPVKVMMGVGGAFDYISGNVPRAPQVVRSIGFEWLYRLLREPWRIKRQLALLEFVKLVLYQVIKSR